MRFFLLGAELEQETSATPKRVWLITDGKPGHLNQLRGLGQRLQHYASVELIEVPVQGSGWWCWLKGSNPCDAAAAPDLVIAAGSRTQPWLLAARRHFNCPAVLLMRPFLPYGWFDAVIVPAHDQPPARPNVLVTQGVVNAVQPGESPAGAEQQLLLVGGESRHYGWDSAALAAQIQALVMEASGAEFVLSDSRRTPADFIPRLQACNLPRLKILSHQQTPAGWLPRAMADAHGIWVTPDSVSMVYEAITSGRPTGIFNLPESGCGRIVAGIEQLAQAGWLTRFDQRDQPPARPAGQLWEADRAARWLLTRLPFHFNIRNPLQE
ncbi:mitochondrial fission ELM1 family protein [Simiduia agarivorans]|uniref:Nucleoside-diphosphate sugar epimerase n=1 Tax=Simiduia agarivorans (strain DSM 21679 / JCM 13881 / BCRC 17597 / SA1) TaxID=1117647 RepID=K4KNC7_SIMAS|nr:ELM1/GtrOC1 family putative glycosyltransferase [Simiduia agarivorans]AFU99715.1 hypothetical protein M5M_12815 [Simiduia agarivorans SA1 = DSM 21679]